MVKTLLICISLLTLGVTGFFTWNAKEEKSSKVIGQAIDSLNGVMVYYNGSVTNVSGRNITKDNYNLGLKYQCVEFIKRYYYEYLKHKMPDTYGHAKDYFNKAVPDGGKNEARNLIQYTNGSKAKPKPNDILILSPTVFNQYGHVSIVVKVTDDRVEVIQQNPGPFSGSREKYSLGYNNNQWTIKNKRILGWLRKK